MNVTLSCGGRVEFCIGGHAHIDHVGSTPDGIPIIIVETDSKNVRGSFAYGANSINESSVNGVIANYDDELLTVVRVGRGNSFTVDLLSGEFNEIPDEDEGGDEGGDEGEDEGGGNTGTPSYVNVLDSVGYKEGYRLSGSSGAETENPGTDISGFIPITSGQTLYLKNVKWKLNDEGYGGFVGMYYADKSYKTGFKLTDTQANSGEYDMVIDDEGYITRIKLSFADLAFVRVCALDINEDSIIIVN